MKYKGDVIVKIVLASNNKGKIQEFKSLLNSDNIQIMSLSDIGINIDIEETGNTLAENSKIKAKTIFNMTGIPTISDDSGLIINSLSKEKEYPGVRTKREFEGLTRRESCERIISLTNPYKDKSCRYTMVLTYIDNDQEIQFEGSCDGLIINDIRGNNGFAIDSIFYSKELQKSFGEATEKEKNTVSHRAKAIKKFQKFLIETKLKEDELSDSIKRK